jgi:hypothetical protein
MHVSGVKLGLCCSRPEGFFRGPAQSSLASAVQFFQVSQADWLDEDELVEGDLLSLEEILILEELEASAADLEQSLEEALENDVTHVLFLSPRTLLPFYSIQALLAMGVDAVSGVSWTWLVGPPGEEPHVFPRIGYYDPEGRPYPYFGWSAPDLFEVDWCGLDCLLLSRRALEEIALPLERIRTREPALRISQCLRSAGVPILIDSSVQCPRVVASPPAAVRRPILLSAPAALADPELTRPRPRLRLVPSPRAWREFSRDNRERRMPSGPLHDPAYRGRDWYRQWVAGLAGGGIY